MLDRGGRARASSSSFFFFISFSFFRPLFSARPMGNNHGHRGAGNWSLIRSATRFGRLVRNTTDKDSVTEARNRGSTANERQWVTINNRETSIDRETLSSALTLTSETDDPADCRIHDYIHGNTLENTVTYETLRPDLRLFVVHQPSNVERRSTNGRVSHFFRQFVDDELVVCNVFVALTLDARGIEHVVK